MQQLTLFMPPAQPVATMPEKPTLTLRSHCKRHATQAQEDCPKCRTRVVTYDTTIDMLRSFTPKVKLLDKADSVDVYLPEYDYHWQATGTNVLEAVNDLFWQLLCAGVGGELTQEKR